MLDIQSSNAQTNPCKAIFELAAMAYKESDLIPLEILERWWQQHPSLFLLAYKDERLCGYISAFPLNNQAFKRTLEPDFDEKKLELSSILSFEAVGAYQMYFSSIVVHPEWRGRGISKALRKTFLNNLILLWLAGRCVTQLSSLVVSAQGVTMMKSLGMNAFQKGQEEDIFYANLTEKSLNACLQLLT